MPFNIAKILQAHCINLQNKQTLQKGPAPNIVLNIDHITAVKYLDNPLELRS